MGPPYGQSDPPGYAIDPALRRRLDDPALRRLRNDPAVRRLAVPDPRVAGLPLPEPPGRNDARYWTLRRRLRRAWQAFRDYPGRRVCDGSYWGTLAICGEPYGCGGSGVLHEPDERPAHVEPQEG